MTYTDELITALADQGVRAEITGTGGNCRAVAILDRGDEILITNGDADLPDEDGVLMIDYRTNVEGDEVLDLCEQPGLEYVDAVAMALVGALADHESN